MRDSSVYWIVESRLAGRMGPNRNPWDLSTLAESGVQFVLSLTERMLNRSSEFHAVGIEHVCLPLPKSAPPLPGDAQAVYRLLPAAHRLILDALVDYPGIVLVHCSSGKDRTGLVLSYYRMMEFGESPSQALAAVRSVQPRLLTANGWQDLAEDVLGRLVH